MPGSISGARVGALLLALLCGAAAAQAQGTLLDQGQSLLGRSDGASQPGAGSLTSGQADSGLREALKVATRRTVDRVGRPGGYLDDSAIRIPLPGFLESARKGMGAVGGSGPLDDLERRMNHAAEEAAPKAFEIIADAVSKMSVNDAIGIVRGPDDAATQYLKRTTTPELTAAFRPVIDHALADAGALQAYNQAKARVGGSSGLAGLAGIMGGGGGGSFDFTGFVVDKALGGLFHYIAKQEADIRTNPAARTTSLLKSVFGH